MSWEPVIGVEIHARLATATKIFCGCPTSFGALPNTQVCPVCLGYPGALPVLNARAVELAIQMALAVGCTVHPTSVFARKNYFYPDLPKGYQISQFDHPLATDGTLPVAGRAIRIQRIHMEEDAGKLLHDGKSSLVDLNRAGSPLIEIVTHPDLRSAEEAAAFFAKIRQILMYVEVCDGNMEEGSLRCDANVSIRRPGEPFGTRAEVKNVNSFRYLARAIEFEIERQTAILESGGIVRQETRLYDPASGETRSMRTKEEAHDYRYFDEPDLPPLVVAEATIAGIAAGLPELPDAKSIRYQKEWGITPIDADALAVTRELASYFEETVASSDNPRAAANWVRNEVLRIVNDRGVELTELPVTPAALGSLIHLVDGGTIGGKAAKEVFEDLATSGGDPREIVDRKGLGQISDPGVLREAASRVIERNSAQVEQYRSGKTQVFGFLVGQLMKETRGKANAELANAILLELLGHAEPRS